MGRKRKFKKRGFASMAKGRLQEIARLGGQTAHAKGVAHQFTSQEARIAGRIGGSTPRKEKIEIFYFDSSPKNDC